MNGEEWLITSVDLAEGLPVIPRNADAAGVNVQLWWKAWPLGELWLPGEVLPMEHGEFLRTVARQISVAVGDRLFDHGFRAALPVVGDNPARDCAPDFHSLAGLVKPLASLAVPQEVSSFKVTVIVCTRRRPDDLFRCLESLMRLEPAPFEILVVNNDPADRDTRAVAETFAGVRCIDEARSGLSRARNTGLRHASGDIVAWTDDDTQVRPNWVGEIKRVFLDSEISGMTGLVLPGALETHAQVCFERDFGGFNRGFRRLTFDVRFFSEMKSRGVPVWMAGAGANMAFRRSVFERLGFFDERLGAGAAGCSEDSEYWYRMLEAGMSIRYEPMAAVHHFHRPNDEGFGRQMAAYMQGHVVALLVQYEKFGHVGNLRRLFLSLPRYYLDLALGRLAGAERGTLRAEVRGCIRGVLWYVRSRLKALGR